MTPNLAARLLYAIQRAGIAVQDVSIGSETDRSTWAVIPASLQGAAQSTIDVFNPDDTTIVAVELDQQATQDLDQQRIFSAIVWTIIDTYSAPATIAKFNAARTKIIAAYRAQPWKP